MVTFAGIKFRNSMKIHYIRPQGELRYGDRVIAEGVRGLDCGTVVLAPMALPEGQAPSPIREMIRPANGEDLAKEENNIRREKEAYHICKEKIVQRGLDMKLIRAECPFDESKILFYFTADGRVDFRELVKDLAGIFRTRIELRQVGVRDETKLLGGMGICGRALCCHSYLGDFVPVSIKMAKEQNLSLNPAKISGTCGRLMCCLKNEAETYAYLSEGLPSKGNQMYAPDGLAGEVVSVDILRQRVQCVVDVGDDERESRDYHISEISFEPNSKRQRKSEGAKADRKNKEPAGTATSGEAAAPLPAEDVPKLSLEEEFLAVSGDIPTPLHSDQARKKTANSRQRGEAHRFQGEAGRGGRDKGGRSGAHTHTNAHANANAYANANAHANPNANPYANPTVSQKGGSPERKKGDKGERGDKGQRPGENPARKNREFGGKQKSQRPREQVRRERNIRDYDEDGEIVRPYRPKKGKKGKSDAPAG